MQHRNLVAFAAAVSDAFMLSDNFGRSAAGRDMHDAAHGPGSIAALRAAIRNGHEPPPAQRVAALASYRWFVVGTVCIG